MQGPRTATRIVIGIASVALAAIGSFAAAPAALAGGQDRASVWDGLYQEEQATRGKVEYDYNCGNCHISDLSGDSIKDVPPLAGTDFWASWPAKPSKECRTSWPLTMPKTTPGAWARRPTTATPPTTSSRTRFPAGSAALGSDPDRLAKAVIEREKK